MGMGTSDPFRWALGSHRAPAEPRAAKGPLDAGGLCTARVGGAARPRGGTSDVGEAWPQAQARNASKDGSKAHLVQFVNPHDVLRPPPSSTGPLELGLRFPEALAPDAALFLPGDAPDLEARRDLMLAARDAELPLPWSGARRASAVEADLIPSLPDDASGPGVEFILPTSQKASSFMVPSHNTRWSDEENLLLKEAVLLYGWGKWKSISQHIGTRTPRQVKNHARDWHKKGELEKTRVPKRIVPAVTAPATPLPVAPTGAAGTAPPFHAAAAAAAGAAAAAAAEAVANITTPAGLSITPGSAAAGSDGGSAVPAPATLLMQFAASSMKRRPGLLTPAAAAAAVAAAASSMCRESTDDGSLPSSALLDSQFSTVIAENTPSWSPETPNSIHDVERRASVEWFVGAPDRTPEQYVQVRNTILQLLDASASDGVARSALLAECVRELEDVADADAVTRVFSSLEDLGALRILNQLSGRIRGPPDDPSALIYDVHLASNALVQLELFAHTAAPRIAPPAGILGGRIVASAGPGQRGQLVVEACCEVAGGRVAPETGGAPLIAALDELRDRELELVGWFQTHSEQQPWPTAAEIDLQGRWQARLADGAPTLAPPFVGLVVSAAADRAASRLTCFCAGQLAGHGQAGMQSRALTLLNSSAPLTPEEVRDSLADLLARRGRVSAAWLGASVAQASSTSEAPEMHYSSRLDRLLAAVEAHMDFTQMGKEDWMAMMIEAVDAVLCAL